ncbi:MAG: amino acid ABC transporter substrate-binding protein [Chloroflexi bacterium]|nr:MAG: amino acid ABC transporter substrate-binding protein [Chloroflexota bacterium]
MLMKMNRNIWIFLLILALTVSSCSLVKPEKEEPCVVTLGFILAESTEEGIQQKAGYEQALEEIVQSNLVDGCEINPIFKDEGSSLNPEAVQNAVRNLADEGAAAVLGATTSDATMRAVNIAKYLKIPLLVPTNASDEITGGGNPWIFRLSPTNGSAAEQILKMIRTKYGSEASISVLFEQTLFGESTAVAIADTALTEGLTISTYTSYAPGALEYVGLVAQSAAKQPDVLFLVASQADQAQGLIGAASKLNIQAVIGSGDGFDGWEIIQDPNYFISSSGPDFFVTTDPISYEIGKDWDRSAEDGEEAVSLSKAEAYLAVKVLAEAVAAIQTNENNALQRLLMDSELSKIRELVAEYLRAENCKDDETLPSCYPVVFDTTGQSNLTPALVESTGRELNLLNAP